jgi:hypothetical protein
MRNTPFVSENVENWYGPCDVRPDDNVITA